MRRYLFLFAAFAPIWAAAPVAAQPDYVPPKSNVAPGTLYGVSRADISASLRRMGMTIDDKTTSGEGPWLIVKTANDETFNVFMYVCANDADPASPCEQVQFRMVWDNTKRRTAADVNRFHLDKVYGRGYVTADGKSVGVEYPMHLKGGVTEANLRENISYFLRVTEDFAEIVKP
jgi:hypothetical protein